MKKTIIFITVLIILFTLPHVSAIDENSTDLISATNDDELISSDNEYIDYDDSDTEFILEINDTKDYETTGNITFYIYFNGTLSFGPEIYDFIKEPITIYENNKNVGTVPVNQINYTTFNQGGNNVFNATFTRQIQNKTQIRLHYSAWDTNTLTIEKILEPELKALTTQTIIIRDKNGIKYTSNNTWNNSIKYLEKAINVASANDEIILTNINIQTTPIFTNPTQSTTINVNKNLKIIGNNAAINANKNSHLFEINSNVTFINMTFTNFSSYLFKNHGNLTFINCTFKDSYTRFINNTGNLIILNSTFKNMKEYYSNAQISLLKDYYTEIGLIYNTGNLQIDNSVFDNFYYPKEIEIDNFTIKELGVIYNLNSATITNTNFTNINTRAINNTGNLKLEKTLFENITTNTLKILINSSKFNKISENTIYQSYTGYREKTTYTTYGNKNYFLNGGAVYNTNNLTITESKFRNIISYYGGAIFNEGNATVNSSNFINTASSGGMGGAIFNNGKMTLENVMINNSKANFNTIQIGKDTFFTIAHGGAIYNNQTLTVNNSIITQSTATYGGAIANNGQIIINNTILDKNYANHERYTGMSYGQTIFNDENGECIIYNSNIKNTITRSADIGGGGAYRRFLGTIYNLGGLTLSKTIFDDIFGEYGSYSELAGSFTIYNGGKLNATYNYFINSPHKENPMSTYYGVFETSYTYAYSNNPNNAYMSNNYYCLNTDPYTIDTNFPVNDYFILAFDPDYYALNLNEVRDITLKLKLASGKEFSNYELLPKANVTIYTYDENGNKINFTKELTNGQVTFPYNYTSTKGRYIISAEMGGGKCIAEIDVGKNKSYMDIKAEDIYYEDNAIFIMNVTGNLTNQPTGNVSIILDGKKYTAEINNTKANLTIPNLPAKTYDLIIRYEGDEDYFKYIHHQNFTVYKKPTGMTLEIPDVYYGERAIGRIFLNTSKYSVKDGHIYITDENNQTTVNQIAIRNNTYVRLTNFASGDLKITVELIGNENYESSNATVIFKIKKYETNLTINASDINAGESETITVTLTPEGEVAGEATFKINNHTKIIFLNNGETNITVENVTGGTYYIEVYFPGDKKYASSNATAKFTAKKLQSNITAKIENDILYINTTPKSTGKVQIFINDDIYEENLKNSQIMFQVNFTKAENYIFIYYQGDGHYNYSKASLTYEYEGLLNLTGYDETFYNTENQTYYLTLTDEEGYGIANRTIAITLNNETSNLITGYDGSITYKLNLDAGNYTITAKYRNKTTTNRITVLEDAFITGNDTQAYTNTDFTYQIQLKDHKGNAIANNEITFKINGKTYTNITNNNGIASLNLNLNKGNYNITTQYKTISHTNNIYIGDLILKGNDLTIYNTETGIYKLSLIDKNGKGVANQTITITLNNQKYTRTTDKNGQTNLKIKLDTGKYTITAKFNDQTITNKITVMEDAFLSVNTTKAYENTDFTHIAKLTDHNGKAIPNAEITFKINDKTYTNKTNKDGLAVLTLNLKEGNYTITTIYKNITKSSKIIIVDDSHLVGNDVKAYSGTDFTYNVKLTDHNNNPITNAEITFNLEDKTFSKKTDSKGKITLTFNLETGNYTITASYKKRSIENNFEIIEDYILSGNDVKAYSETNFIYNVKLTDHNGKAIKNAEITFTANGKKYNNKTDVNGKTIISLSLKTGTYTITARYRNTTTTNTLTIIEDYILNGNDIKAYEDDDFTYKVNLTDHNGKAIPNTEITFKINDKTYTNKTNKNGLAALTLNLKEGNYTITAKYKNTTTTNELEIIENHVMTGQNIKAYENTDFTYTITLKRTDGKALTDKEITFIINNRRYTDMTNSEGKASKTLNLPEGNYTITAIYKNTKITNNLTIIEDYNIDANNIRAYADDNFQYRVNLTDHNKKPVKNAEITFEINGQIYKNKTDNQGQTRITLNLKEGNYTITAKYKNIKITNKLEIIETYTLKGINVKSYENFDFEYNVTLKNHNDKTIENAEITFEINGKTYKNKTDKQGQATITLNLKEGNYTITAKYKNTTTTNKLNIIKYDLEKIESSDLIMYYKDGSRFTIRLTENSTALTNKTVQFTINGNTYKRTTNDEGYASIAINLNSGIHKITTRYNNISTKNTITIKSTIEGNDLTKIYKNDTQYYATFYNQKGEQLKNTKVTFNINGVMYERNTNENGQAKLNINLIAGTYIITAINPENSEQHSNTITVLSKIQENKDLTKYYQNDSQYIVKIIDSKGNPAKAGQKVTFNINGVFYERYADETGHVKMNINLAPGEYIITAEYEGCKVSNKIKVLPILKASDLTKKYGTKTPFEATLIDGKGNALKNTAITFNINGVFYTRTTNENGIAKLNINLMPGEYIITSSYNGANIANKVKIQA